MNQENILQQAKAGNTDAISALINKSLQPRGISIQVSKKGDSLIVIAESRSPLEQGALTEFLKNGIQKLAPVGIRKVIIQGRTASSQDPAWESSFSLESAVLAPTPIPTPEEESGATLPTIGNSDSTQSKPQTKPVAKVYKAKIDSRLIEVWNFLVQKVGLTNAIIIASLSAFPLGLILLVILIAIFAPEQETKTSPVASPNPPQKTPEKTPEIMEVLETPAGPLPVLKWVGDPCLQVEARESHMKYYGMDELKKSLKARYNLTCVLWADFSQKK